MTTIRSYDYVNRPYEQVRTALRTDPQDVFHAATRVASTEPATRTSELRVKAGALDVAAEIDVEVEIIEETTARRPTTRFRLSWKAVRMPQLFPLMHAELAVYPLSATETQLAFTGEYEPPLGPLGIVLDAVAGERIAEACVTRFVGDVARHLRSDA
jgi:hypothetical protein